MKKPELGGVKHCGQSPCFGGPFSELLVQATFFVYTHVALITYLLCLYLVLLQNCKFIEERDSLKYIFVSLTPSAWSRAFHGRMESPEVSFSRSS